MVNINKSCVGLRTKCMEIDEEQLPFFICTPPGDWKEDFTQLEWVAQIDQAFFEKSKEYPNPARWRMRRLAEFWAFPYVKKDDLTAERDKFLLREGILKMYDAQILWACLVTYIKEYALASRDSKAYELYLQVCTYVYDKNEAGDNLAEMEAHLKDYASNEFQDAPIATMP